MNPKTVRLATGCVWISGVFMLGILLVGCPEGFTFSNSSEENASDPPAVDPIPPAPTPGETPPPEEVVSSGETESGEPSAGSPAPTTAPITAAQIEVPVDGQGKVNQQSIGTYLELTAVPDDEWRFEGWFGTLETTANPVMILPGETTSIVARFVSSVEPDTGPDPEPELDSDADGVLDENDECPNTSADTNADEAGCAPAQRDDDADTVNDANDQCPETPAGETADTDGCGPSQRDGDRDGITDDADQCPETSLGAVILLNGPSSGCALSQLDADNDQVSDNIDQCPFTEPDALVDDKGCVIVVIVVVCGNSIREGEEQCDPPDGVTCDSLCQIIFPPLDNDDCAAATVVNDGLISFTNLGANTDGPTDAQPCDVLGADVWFCYTAPCSDIVTVNLCDSLYDTMMTAYESCTCPPAGAMACDDDFCGGLETGTGSQISFPAVAGESYLIRVGGWSGLAGSGTLSISCGAGGGAVCGDNLVEPPEQCDPPDGVDCDAFCRWMTGGDDPCEDNGWYGDGECDLFCPLPDPDCGGAVDECELNGWYGDGECDLFCPLPDPDCAFVDECELYGWYGDGVCDLFCPLPDPDCGGGGGCGVGAGSCFSTHSTPGCDDATCCDLICGLAPWCCTLEWDADCVDGANALCGGSVPGCGPGAGSCLTANGTPGCEDDMCCTAICNSGYPECCDFSWDAFCASLAAELAFFTDGAICGP